MSDIGWRCANCQQFNAHGFDECPNCHNGSQRTPVQLSDLEPVRMRKRGKNRWLYQRLFFDSKDEALRYGYLKQLQDNGIIRHLCVQPTMLIRDSFALSSPFYVTTKAGKARTIPNETYTPDYAYVYGKYLIIEDVKGMSKGKPYSKGNSDRSQKHLMYRYRHKHHVVFMLSCEQNGVWRYFQASMGYPELDFELVAIAKEQAA